MATYNEIRADLQLFIDATVAKHNYAYTTGYLKSKLIELVEDLPKAKQKAFLDTLRVATAKMELS